MKGDGAGQGKRAGGDRSGRKETGEARAQKGSEKESPPGTHLTPPSPTCVGITTQPSFSVQPLKLSTVPKRTIATLDCLTFSSQQKHLFGCKSANQDRDKITEQHCHVRVREHPADNQTL